MVKLEAIRKQVATAVRPVASSASSAGHTSDEERSVKYAAKSPAKNMSSDANHTTTPTPRMEGRRTVGVATAIGPIPT